MNELKLAVALYERNRENLCNALTDAGGNAELIIKNEGYREVLTNLAANGILMDCKKIERQP